MMLVLSLFVGLGNFAICEEPTQNKTIKLVEKIRRQLMENNYDYLPSEEELFPTTLHYDQDMANYPMSNDNETTEKRDGQNLFVPRAQESVEESKVNDHAISKKDLYYYMDDDRLRRTMNNNVYEANDDFDDTNANDTSPRVKYKVIKVKSLNPNRRSLSYGRFIQEENKDGVAIISLDGHSFPEFHLPRSRRQYINDGESKELGEDPNANGTRIDNDKK